MISTDVVEAALQRQPVKTRERQIHKNLDPIAEPAIRIGEGLRDLNWRAVNRGWIGYAPMRAHRLAGPNRAHLASSVVANGEHEIERRRIRSCELFPILRAK